MPADWTPEQLHRIDAAQELDLAVRRPDGTLRTAVPVWVVRVDTDAYVRTWYRRDTGWYGRVLRSGRAHVDGAGVSADVQIEDVGAGPPELRAAVDSAYRAKYRAGGTDRMVTAEAAATTLRLTLQQRGA